MCDVASVGRTFQQSDVLIGSALSLILVKSLPVGLTPFYLGLAVIVSLHFNVDGVDREKG